MRKDASFGDASFLRGINCIEIFGNIFGAGRYISRINIHRCGDAGSCRENGVETFIQNKGMVQAPFPLKA